jgi:hypothetical protein
MSGRPTAYGILTPAALMTATGRVGSATCQRAAADP